MRTLASFLVLFVLLLAGCENVSDNVRDRFSPVPPKVRQFEGDLRTVFTAAQLAFKRLDFVLTDSSGAPSRLEASSPIDTNDALGDARQLVADLKFHSGGEGKTEVEMLLSRQVSSGSLAGSGAQDLREHGFYETFFATLQDVLQERSGGTR